MKGEQIPVKILSLRMIANVSPALRSALGLDARHRALGLISADSDDATYLALDEATKAANVDVVYARSLYAGAANATTRLAGEVIGILGGENPSDILSALRSAQAFLSGSVGFRSADEAGGVVYLAHCVASCGSYLASVAHVPVGQALAYLIAPPVEAVLALDAALKVSDVELADFFAPPSETNFAGALLTGTQSACKAACDAFAAAVCAVAEKPIELGGWNYGA